MYGIPNMKLDKRSRRAPRRADGGRGRQVRLQREGRRERRRRRSCCASSTRSCSAAARRKPRDLPDRGPRTSRASTSPWSSCTPTPRACSTASRGRHSPISAQGQGRDRHRRRRHRHRLRRHVDAPRLPEPHAARDPAEAAGRARRGQPWPQWPKVYKLDYGQEEAAAQFGGDPREYLTTEEVRRRRERPAHRRSRPCRSSGSQRQRQVRPGRGARHREDPSRPAGAAGDGLPRPGSPLLDQLGVESDTRTNVKAEHGQLRDQPAGRVRGGRMRRGQSLVVWAINEGRGVAEVATASFRASSRARHRSANELKRDPGRAGRKRPPILIHAAGRHEYIHVASARAVHGARRPAACQEHRHCGSAPTFVCAAHSSLIDRAERIASTCASHRCAGVRMTRPNAVRAATP